MLKKSISLCLGVAAVAAGVFMAPESAEAAALWSWSFGSPTNGAAGTFTTTDVLNPNNPVGTYSVLQFTLESLNGNPVSAIDTALQFSPSFVYNSATNYGFTNTLFGGFFDSGTQTFDSVGDDVTRIITLSGSAAYQAALPEDLQRDNSVTFFTTPSFEITASARQFPADLQVSLLSPPPTPTPIPTPALLPGLAGLGLATLRKKKSDRSD